jgi:HEAT repeats
MCREAFPRPWPIAEGIVLSMALQIPYVTSHAASQKDADALVQQLSGLPAEIQSSGFSQICSPAPAECPPRPLPPGEAKRKSIYDQLFALGEDGVAALARALRSPDQSLRSNAALALGVLGGGWWKSNGSKIDISDALPALEIALQDPDSRTQALAAQDIGDIGEAAAQAVPALVELLASADEGLRNSACIGLRGIGPPARVALPALREALADPSPDVRRFAESAIASIGERPSQQSESIDANADVLTIRISEDGVCHFMDASAPCDQLGQYLLTRHLAQNGRVHIAVDRTAKYELVAATLKSLDGLGFKVGFVNNDASASQ